MEARYRTIADAIAKEHGLNPAVVAAICSVESEWDTYAVRYEPGWRYLLNPATWARMVRTSKATEEVLQSCSWGLMQVMGTVARELGFDNDFPRLCDPRIGLRYGCLKLKKCLERHPSLPDALAAYNAGTPKSKAGQAYAQKVIAKM